jgi:palmitoyltransferase
MTVVNASPVVLLCLIFTWSYWAFNFSLAVGLLKEGHTLQGKRKASFHYKKPHSNIFFLIGSLYILFYHPIFILCMWSYWAVCRTSPGFTVDVSLSISLS